MVNTLDICGCKSPQEARSESNELFTFAQNQTFSKIALKIKISNFLR